MSLMRRAMEYLGLVGEDMYDDFPQGAGRPGGRPSPNGRARHGRGRRYDDEYDDYDQESDEFDEDVDDYDEYDDLPPRRRTDGADRRPARPGASSSPSRGGRPSRTNDSGVHVRPIARGQAAGTSSAEAVSVRPVRFEEAKDIGDLLKSGQAVKMDIGSADEDTARRLIDFASGLVYASEGSIDRVAAGVFVLRPRASRTIRI